MRSNNIYVIIIIQYINILIFLSSIIIVNIETTMIVTTP